MNSFDISLFPPALFSQFDHLRPFKYSFNQDAQFSWNVKYVYFESCLGKCIIIQEVFLLSTCSLCLLSRVYRRHQNHILCPYLLLGEVGTCTHNVTLVSEFGNSKHINSDPVLMIACL